MHCYTPLQEYLSFYEMARSAISTSTASDEQILVSDRPPGRPSPAVRKDSLTSRYYCNPGDCPKECCEGASDFVGHASTFSVKQSAPMPTWLWLVLAQCLRVPLPEKKGCRFLPFIGLLLQALTVLSCIGLCVLHAGYEVRRIMVSDGEQKTLYRCASIFVMISWALFGLYARRLARRLFSHPSFIKDIRMHSKTLFKMNAAALAITLGALFLAVNAYSARAMIRGEACASIGFPPAICTMHFACRVVYSIFSLLWHGLVCTVLVSVARTHTIGIRRFIKELEADAVHYETANARQCSGPPITAEDICEESDWIEDNLSPSDSYIVDDCYKERPQIRLRSCGEESQNISVLSGSYDCDLTRSANLSVNTSQPARTLSIAEILHAYWKVSCRLRLTGRALQRWVGSLIGVVVFWCSTQLVSWLNHSPSAWEVLQFVCPLALLLVIASSIAEVNLEGSRMLKCIRPTEERLPMMNFLSKAPLQLLTFGFSLSYGTILTVVLGVLMAFTSKLIIVEIQGHTS